MIILKSRKEIERMRESGKIVAEILEMLKSRVLPGETTERLDAFAEAETKRFWIVPGVMSALFMRMISLMSINSVTCRLFRKEKDWLKRL